MFSSICTPLSISEKGKRANNEDSIYPFDKPTVNDRLFMVCDGVGGAPGGEVASRMVCESISFYLADRGIHQLRSSDIAYAVQFAKAKMNEYVRRHPALAEMSSTLTLLYRNPANITVGWLGDSRIYHIREGNVLFKCKEYITGGYRFAVDMDLEKFFDSVSHSKLTEVLSRTIKDGRVISLIHKYLNAGVMTEGREEPVDQGVRQGGPLSPLLGKIMLNELERRGHKFVRYADDMVILCKSNRSAERTMKSIISFIEGKLFLKVNREKSKVTQVRGVKFSGYTFYVSKGEGRLRIHPKSVQTMKAKIKMLTSRSNGWGKERRKEVSAKGNWCTIGIGLEHANWRGWVSIWLDSAWKN